MKNLTQFMILVMFYFLGFVLQTLLHLPIPGTVIGLLLLLLGLITGVVKLDRVEDVSDNLLSNLSFLFVPAGVGLITSFSILEGKWMPFLIIIVVSTLVVFIVTASVAVLLRKDHKHE